MRDFNTEVYRFIDTNYKLTSTLPEEFHSPPFARSIAQEFTQDFWEEA